MSIYNEPVEWARNAIESILNQTYADFELIIINDNPERDENRTLLTEYLNKDKRVKPIYNQSNIGLTASLNRGLKIASGRYIARMDADDISSLDRLEKQYDYMEKNKDVDVLNSYAELFSESNYSLGYKKPPVNHKSIIKALQFECVLIHPASFIRTSFLKNHDISYNEKFRRSQDYGLWMTMGLEGAVFHTLPIVLLKYRLSDNQISRRNSFQQYQDYIRIRLSVFTEICKRIDIHFLIHPTLDYVKVVREKMGSNYNVFYKSFIFQLMYSVPNSASKFLYIIASPIKFRWTIKQFVILILSYVTQRWDGYNIYKMKTLSEK